MQKAQELWYYDSESFGQKCEQEVMNSSGLLLVFNDMKWKCIVHEKRSRLDARCVCCIVWCVACGAKIFSLAQSLPNMVAVLHVLCSMCVVENEWIHSMCVCVRRGGCIVVWVRVSRVSGVSAVTRNAALARKWTETLLINLVRDAYFVEWS